MPIVRNVRRSSPKRVTIDDLRETFDAVLALRSHSQVTASAAELPTQITTMDGKLSNVPTPMRLIRQQPRSYALSLGVATALALLMTSTTMHAASINPDE